METEISLSEEGYLAMVKFIALIWNFSELGMNPSSYITADAEWQRDFDLRLKEAA